MALPTEITKALEIYRTCKTYSDKGTIQRSTQGTVENEDSMSFSTEFERETSLHFQGHSIVQGKDVYLPNDEAFSMVFIKDWIFRYDWRIATFEAQISGQKPYCQSDADLDVVFAPANAASRGCGGILLP